MMSSHMAGIEIRLLGPLALSVNGALWSPGSSRQRIVLAILLLEANRVVPVSRLIDAVWEDQPPATAKSQVQTCISALRQHLRRAGAESVIATRPAGYEICVPDDGLDISAFQRLASSGMAAAADDRGAEAVGELRAALSMWRGTAAVDVESQIVQSAAARLNEDRLRVLEECLALELDLGRHHDLVGELTELVQAHPLRERLRAQHMLALYGSDRQVEALESFRAARELFVEELGVEPGLELRRLQQSILANDTTLELPVAADRQGRAAAVIPRQLPAAIADFTGRQASIAKLTEALSRSEAQAGSGGSPPVVVLVGKGGVGKSALALHIAHAVRQCYPDGQLFASLREGDSQPISPQELLARFLRALGVSPAALQQTLAERAATYRSLLCDRRVLIVLDDADAASQIVPLIPGGPGCAVIVTSRSPLPGVDGVLYLEVDDLDEDTSVELIGRVIGPGRLEGQADSAHALARFCGCLPLALRIAAARLLERPHWSIGQMVRRMTDEDRRLDELTVADLGIRATLSLSYRSLDSAAQRLFARLGLLEASDFAPWVCIPLLDAEAKNAEDALDALVRAHLVDLRVSAAGPPRLGMHNLIRIYARERLAAEVPAAERASALQRLLGGWLYLATAAHRMASGGDFAVLHGRVPAWPLPDDIRDRLLSGPLDWFRTEHAGLVSAILQAARAGLDELCWDLAVTSVTLFESDNHVEDWRRTHEAALDLARRAGNRRGEAALLYSLANLELGLRPDEAVRCLDPALSIFVQLGDRHGRALTLSALASIDRLSGRHAAALERYQDALAGFEQAGDKVSQADALANMGQIKMDRRAFGEAERMLAQALLICRAIKAPRAMAQAEYRYGELFLHLGDFERARQSFEVALEVVRDTGDLIGEAYSLGGLIAVHTEQEQYELAEADLAAALSLSARMNDNVIHGRILLSGAELFLAKDEISRAMALLSEALVVFSEVGPAPVWRVRFLELRSRVYQRAGRTAAAAAARQEAIDLAGELDPALARSLVTTAGPVGGSGRWWR
jgi:DNA-binding SARP family transcriptional activator/tetratricopeptide (TPR) repeat protein